MLQRRVLAVTIVFCSIWLALGSRSFWNYVSGNGVSYISNNGTSPKIKGITGGQGFRHRFMNFVSLKYCAWLFDNVEASRNPILKAEAVHLEPEHLALPLLRNPYPDYSKWSVEEKAKALKGLDWLIDHYDARWPSD
ncbi:hypothetical protein QFC19_009208 [Naganishia cerealis]|uniref:Uncharacterized protein n=1 Tax=Naganishia cerealis TaxID=610337 RepID=A0ACC2UWR3_9TREE|nr:hypothetical protein QFC19_009208 [Naganishia cerealis]